VPLSNILCKSAQNH